MTTKPIVVYGAGTPWEVVVQQLSKPGEDVRFLVAYGANIKSPLTYRQAATEIGEFILADLEINDKIVLHTEHEP